MLTRKQVFGDEKHFELQNFFLAIGVSLPGTQVPPEAAAAFWLYQLLRQLPGLNPACRNVLLSAIWKELATAAADWDSEAPKCRDFFIGFCDGRYAAWTGLTGYMDLSSGEIRNGYAPESAVSTAINLRVVYRDRCTEALKNVDPKPESACQSVDG